MKYNWHTIDRQLAYNWHTTGIQLTDNWHTIDRQLTYNWQTTDIQLTYNWHTIAIQLEDNWKTIEREYNKKKTTPNIDYIQCDYIIRFFKWCNHAQVLHNLVHRTLYSVHCVRECTMYTIQYTMYTMRMTV